MVMAFMVMSSVITTPSNPICPRSVPVMMRFERVAGKSLSMLGTSTWAVMMALGRALATTSKKALVCDSKVVEAKEMIGSSVCESAGVSR